MSLTLLVFHFEISGIDDNDSHPLNIKFKLVALLEFQFVISGKYDNDEIHQTYDLYLQHY